MSEQKQDEAVVKPEPIEPTREDAIRKITKCIVDNGTWMLTLHDSDDSLRSVPMLNINDAFHGELYAIASEGDRVVDAITRKPQINLSIGEADDSIYLSISGVAYRCDDQKKLELLWTDRCKKWFGSDQPDDSVQLLKFNVSTAEYWDATQDTLSRISNFFSADSTPMLEEVEHKTVRWSSSRNPALGVLMAHNR